MQRVFRSTFVGVLALAALTACGDKNTTPQATVTGITVTPATASVAVGGKTTFVATVTGTGNFSSAVAWSSSDPTIATVDAATGVVTGVAAGSTTIIATSSSNSAVKGAASVTVGSGSNIPVTVTISSVNQTTAAGSVPATLSAVTGQLDVTLNVDPGSQKLTEVDLIMNCGGADTVVAKETISANVVPIAADGSAAPVTLSFNTAAFNPQTGAVAFRNGACTLSAAAITTTGTQKASNPQPLTLANVDVVNATMTTAPSAGQVATAIDQNGLGWKAGSVTVTVVPVVYTAGRSIASASITLTTPTPVTLAGTLSGGIFTATFPNGSGTGSVAGITAPNVSPIVVTTDNLGNNGPSLAASTTNFIRLDNQAPTVSGVTSANVNFNSQNNSGNWIGANFAFTSSLGFFTGGVLGSNAAGCVVTTPLCDNNGVDKVVQNNQFAVGSSSTFTTFTSVSSIPESSTATAYTYRAQFCDALGNCAATAALGTFGVDVTAPKIQKQTAGPANNEIVGIGGSFAGGTTFAVVATDSSATGSTVNGSGLQNPNPLFVTESVLAPSGATGQATSCVIGNPLSPNTGCKSAVAQGNLGATSFSPVVTAPGQYALVVQAIDQAGNLSTPDSVQFYIDQAAPVVGGGGGGIGIPASIASGAQFASSATDDMDLGSANSFLSYSEPGPVRVRIPQSAALATAGVAFDNTLTRSSALTATVSQFYRGLGTVDAAGTTLTAGVKPDSIGIRAVDVANNLSSPQEVALPGANISTPGTFAIGTDFNVFQFTPSATTVANGTSSAAHSITLTGSVQAVNLTQTAPFSNMCFYYQALTGAENGAASKVNGQAAGENVLIGCTSTPPAETVTGGVRTFTYSMTWDPPAGLGTSGTVNVLAIGNNTSSDAVMTPATAITLTN